MKLGKIVERYFREEGFKSPQDFVETWKKLHPRKGYDPQQYVFLHMFVRRNILLATTSWPGHPLQKEEVVNW